MQRRKLYIQLVKSNFLWKSSGDYEHANKRTSSTCTPSPCAAIVVYPSEELVDACWFEAKTFERPLGPAREDFFGCAYVESTNGSPILAIDSLEMYRTSKR